MSLRSPGDPVPLNPPAVGTGPSGPGTWGAGPSGTDAFDADARDAADPTALGFTLERIAAARPDLWPVIAANPAAPGSLLDSLRARGDATADSVLERRRAAETGPVGGTPPGWRPTDGVPLYTFDETPVPLTALPSTTADGAVPPAPVGSEPTRGTAPSGPRQTENVPHHRPPQTSSTPSSGPAHRAPALTAPARPGGLSAGAVVVIVVLALVSISLVRSLLDQDGPGGQTTPSVPASTSASPVSITDRGRYGEYLSDPSYLSGDFTGGLTPAWRVPGLAEDGRVEVSEGGDLVAAELASGYVGVWDLADEPDQDPVKVWQLMCPHGWALVPAGIWCGATFWGIPAGEGTAPEDLVASRTENGTDGHVVGATSSTLFVVDALGADGEPEGGITAWSPSGGYVRWHLDGPFRDVSLLTGQVVQATDAATGETVLLDENSGQELARAGADTQVTRTSGSIVLLLDPATGHTQVLDPLDDPDHATQVTELEAGGPVHLTGVPDVWSLDDVKELLRQGVDAAARGTWLLTGRVGSGDAPTVTPLDAGTDCASWTINGHTVDAVALSDGSGTCPSTMLRITSPGTGTSSGAGVTVLVTGPGGSQLVDGDGTTLWTVHSVVHAVDTRLLVANDHGDLVGYMPVSR